MTNVATKAAFLHENANKKLSVFYLDEKCTEFNFGIGQNSYKSLWHFDLVETQETLKLGTKRKILSAESGECFDVDTLDPDLPMFGNQLTLQRWSRDTGISNMIVDISDPNRVVTQRATRTSIFNTDWYVVLSRFPLIEGNERFYSSAFYFSLKSLITGSYNTTFYGNIASQDRARMIIKHLTGAEVGLSKQFFIPIPTDDNRLFATHVGDNKGNFLPFVLLIEPSTNRYQLIYIRDLNLTGASAIYYSVHEKKLLYLNDRSRIQIAVPET